jgi:hypothetical protein
VQSIVHEPPVQVCAQSPPGQLIVQEPPVQVWVQSPCAQSMEHVAEMHVWLQSFSAHVLLHRAPGAHSYWQSLRPPPHVSMQAALAAHVHVWSPESAHENPFVSPAAELPRHPGKDETKRAMSKRIGKRAADRAGKPTLESVGQRAARRIVMVRELLKRRDKILVG